MSTTNDQKKMDENQVDYLKTELEMAKAKKVPSKLSSYPLVSFVEKDGELLPVYRYEE